MEVYRSEIEQFDAHQKAVRENERLVRDSLNAIRDAIAEEREACAQVVEGVAKNYALCGWLDVLAIGTEAAQRIRERGNP